MSESFMGYGQIQVADDRIVATNGLYYTSIRGDISTVLLSDLDPDLKMSREHANFAFKVQGKSRLVYVKGCEVRAITLFDEDEGDEVLGDTWVVE